MKMIELKGLSRFLMRHGVHLHTHAFLPMALDGATSDELDAVLAVLGEMSDVDFRFPLPPSNTSISVEANCSAALKKARKKRRPESSDPNKARKERARELRELRASVQQLTERLAALQVVVADRNGKLVPATLAQTRDRQGELKVWEELARSQFSQRLASEGENARLKRALETAQGISDTLQQAAAKSSRSMNLRGVGGSMPSIVHTLLLDSEADTKMFEVLIKEVDASYYEASEAFRLNGLTHASNEPRFGVQMHEGERGRFMDMFAEDILPFAVEDTSRVVWEFYSGPAKHRGQLYFKTAKTIKTSHETIIEKFTIEHHALSMDRVFCMFQVLRRYAEGDRVLVVWISAALPVETSRKPASVFGYCQKGYVLCEPFGREPMQDAPPSFTRLRRCHRVTPYLPLGFDRNFTRKDKQEISAIMEWALDLNTIRFHLEHFENQLLAESLQRQRQAT